MHSIWKNDVTMPKFPTLKGEHKTDVLVIGGGMCGVLCAHRLQAAGLDCVLLEAGELGEGTTANTTAKLSIAEPGAAGRVKALGRERAAQYYRAKAQAMGALLRLGEQIPCEMERTDDFLFATDGAGAVEKELAALHTLGVRADYLPSLPLPFANTGAIRVPGGARFHPLKLLAGLAKDLRIFTRSRVVDLAPGWAKTEGGATVRAKRIIVATHFPFLNKHGGYFLKQYQNRSYVLALENVDLPDGNYRDLAENGLSFRRYGEVWLMGGGGHRTGKNSAGWSTLESLAKLYFPASAVVAKWAAQDCMTLDTLPYIGQYGKHTPGLFVATGFQKWGMTGAMAAALTLEDILLDRKSTRHALFSPRRAVLRPQLLTNLMESTLGLITPKRRRCPHLGCALQWNPYEHSWDCPCHGSRFSAEGKVLDGPANGDHPHLP